MNEDISTKDKATIAANDFRRWCKVQRLTAELEASADAATTDAFDPFVEVSVKPKPVKLQPVRKPVREKVKVTQDDLLMWIKANQPCTVASISRGLLMNESTVINRVNQLEFKGAFDITWDFADSRHSRKSKYYMVREAVTA
jgi:hypothetical protein